MGQQGETVWISLWNSTAYLLTSFAGAFQGRHWLRHTCRKTFQSFVFTFSLSHICKGVFTEFMVVIWWDFGLYFPNFVSTEIYINLRKLCLKLVLYFFEIKENWAVFVYKKWGDFSTIKLFKVFEKYNHTIYSSVFPLEAGYPAWQLWHCALDTMLKCNLSWNNLKSLIRY